MLNLRVCSALVQQRSQEVFESGFSPFDFSRRCWGPRASDSGCVGIGWLLRCWSGHASVGRCHGTSWRFDSSCLRNFTGIPRPSGRAGRTPGRRSRNVGRGAMRVTFWGALAVALTAGVGSLFGTDA